MEREKVIELAKIAGIIFNEGNPAGSHMVDKMVEFSRLVEQETLERAAIQIEDYSELLMLGSSGTSVNMVLSAIGKEFSAQIRNLKDNHDKE